MMPQDKSHACTNSEQPQEVTASGATCQVIDNTPDGSVKIHTFKWTPAKERAAQLLAYDKTTDAEIAATVGVDDSSIHNWKRFPEFRERIEVLRKKFTEKTLHYLIRSRSFRLGNYQRRLLACEQVIAERAQDPEMQDVPGGKSGLLTKKVKYSGRGESAKVEVEYKFDAALAKEMRELEKQAAIEVGQWVDKVAPVSPDGEQEYGAGVDLERFQQLTVTERIRILRQASRLALGNREEPPRGV